MWHVRAVFIFITLFSFSANAQQLIINEVSQGTGSKEYVEFVVIGTPTCQTPVPCIDLRGVIIDDNNGYFAPGAGTGIASGAIRFANSTFWSCVPQGTYIVVYNEADLNPALPPLDESLTDGNCRLVIPSNSALLEGTSTSPTSSISTYPGNSSWTVGGGNWNQIAMSNSNDSFQIPNLGINGTPLHGVSWGNNTNGTIIYFAGGAGNKVFSFTNATSSDWNLQANWASGDVGVNETPGAPNTPENDAWIASMNPQCGVSAGMQVTVAITNVTCGATCNGTATAQVTGGTAPYTYSWNTTATSAGISSLCPATYTVTVTDAGGCTFTAQGTVQTSSNNLQLNFTTTSETCSGACDGASTVTPSGGVQPYQYNWSNSISTANNPNLCPGTYSVSVTDQNGCAATGSATIGVGSSGGDATIQAAGPFTTSDAPVQLQSSANGGTWVTADCTGCLSATGVFNPQASGAGSFQICHTIGSGNCMSNACITIVVTDGCTPQTTTQNLPVCAGDSVLIFGNWEHIPAVYSQTFTDIHGCDSIRIVVLTNKTCTTDTFSLFVPNTFTPNGDNVNDLFTIVLLGGQLEEGYIFNRWGNEIKRFDGSNLNWDGRTSGGDPVQDGVYTYILFYTPTNGNRATANGFVSVFR